MLYIITIMYSFTHNETATALTLHG